MTEFKKHFTIYEDTLKFNQLIAIKLSKNNNFFFIEYLLLKPLNLPMM